MNNARLDQLHPDIQPLHAKLFEELPLLIAPSVVETTFTFRVPAVQDALYAQGRTTPGDIVTDVTSQKSKHCFTLNGHPAAKAFDIAILEPDGRYVRNGDDQRYLKAGSIWDRLATENPNLGLMWGGHWHRPHDPSHFQIA